MTLEREIEQKLVSEVRKHGGWALKFTSPGTNGVPDRLCILPGGRIFFAELKRPGEKPRPLQEAVIRKLRALGATVYVVDSKETAEEVMRNELQAP